MRILLTGSTGFVGSHLLRSLLAGGRHEVAVLLRAGSNPWRVEGLLGRVTRVEADLADLGRASPAVEAFAPEAFVHLAWGGVQNALRNHRAQVDNIRPVADLVEMARRVGARHWVGLGSQAEYGPSRAPTGEDAPERPTTLYGVTKLSAGMVARHLCAEAGIRFAWVRLFSTYGPMDDPSWMVPSLVLKLLRGERPALTEGAQLWDYVYVGDAAGALQRVVLSPDAAGVFNLGSGRSETIRGIVERLRDMIDPGLPLGFGEVPYRPDQVMHLQADVRRLGEATGWSPEVGLDEGLRRTVTWFRENRWRYER